jgi:cysteine synthase
VNQEERDERAQAPEYATFSKEQRDALRLIGCRVIVLASDPEASRVQVMAALEEAARAVSGMELKDFRSRLQCPGCLNDFTSRATMRQHYEGRSLQCIDPMTLPQLEQKPGGRWGWSAQAREYFKARAEQGL